MTDKQIDTCEFLNICQTNCNGTLENTEICHCYELYKQLKRAENQIVDLNKMVEAKEQECEELKKQWEFSVTHKMILEKDYKAELDQLKAENERLKKTLKELISEVEDDRQS